MAKLNIENDMTGLLFLNDSENENAPEFNGAIKVNGEHFDIAIWPKDFKNSSGYTVKISEPYRKDDADEVPPRRSSGGGGSAPSRGVRPRPKPSRSR
jgi:hypothetical protein